jgi:hypothetical protein
MYKGDLRRRIKRGCRFDRENYIKNGDIAIPNYRNGSWAYA